MSTSPPMSSHRHMTLIVHDDRKADLLDWARFNRATLAPHELHATGTTGELLADDLDLDVSRFLSGPLMGEEYRRSAPSTTT